MAWSWSLALWLVLTLAALITFSQPLFQTATEVRHKHGDLEPAPQQNFVTFKAQESMVEDQRQHTTRKMIQHNKSKQQRQPQPQGICKGKRKTILPQKTSSSTTTSVASDRHQPLAPAVARPEIIPAKCPPRPAPAQFQSNRMVPSGPNPLHNNNRSQVLFP